MQRMNSLRRSFRDSFRKKRESPESSKPHQWQADEEAVRGGNCSFHVKYLGCVEVFESRGMQVCEEAMKVLRASRRRPVKAVLYISGDGLRVVEDDTKGLIVDQTIEKVSFCAPDRNHERGFSYICRDGTTRRWMCHGFLASKDSGERLSHAVGCAFASCLERKQRREKECGVSMTFDPKTSTFTRSGSFRVCAITDNVSEKSISPPPNDGSGAFFRSAVNPHAIERPRAPTALLERQGSFRGFTQLANQSPFKRQLSLRLDDLPSNLIRAQQNTTEMNNGCSTSSNIPAASPNLALPPRTRNRLQSLPNNSLGGTSTIPESTSINGNGDSRNLLKLENKDLVSELCQQVSQGLSLLAANHDDVKNVNTTASQFSTKFTNPWDDEVGQPSSGFNSHLPILSSAIEKSSNISRSNFAPGLNKPVDNWIQNIPIAPPFYKPPVPAPPVVSNSPLKIINAEVNRIRAEDSPSPVQFSKVSSSSLVRTSSMGSSSQPTTNGGGSTTTNKNTTSGTTSTKGYAPQPGQRPPLINSGCVQQQPGLGIRTSAGIIRGGPGRSQSLGADPFDADWATPAARSGQTPTNPFARQQAFQISM